MEVAKVLAIAFLSNCVLAAAGPTLTFVDVQPDTITDIFNSVRGGFHNLLGFTADELPPKPTGKDEGYWDSWRSVLSFSMRDYCEGKDADYGRNEVTGASLVRAQAAARDQAFDKMATGAMPIPLYLYLYSLSYILMAFTGICMLVYSLFFCCSFLGCCRRCTYNLTGGLCCAMRPRKDVVNYTKFWKIVTFVVFVVVLGGLITCLTFILASIAVGGTNDAAAGIDGATCSLSSAVQHAAFGQDGYDENYLFAPGDLTTTPEIPFLGFNSMLKGCQALSAYYANPGEARTKAAAIHETYTAALQDFLQVQQSLEVLVAFARFVDAGARPYGHGYMLGPGFHGPPTLLTEIDVQSAVLYATSDGAETECYRVLFNPAPGEEDYVQVLSNLFGDLANMLAGLSERLMSVVKYIHSASPILASASQTPVAVFRTVSVIFFLPCFTTLCVVVYLIYRNLRFRTVDLNYCSIAAKTTIGCNSCCYMALGGIGLCLGSLTLLLASMAGEGCTFTNELFVTGTKSLSTIRAFALGDLLKAAAPVLECGQDGSTSGLLPPSTIDNFDENLEEIKQRENDLLTELDKMKTAALKDGLVTYLKFLSEMGDVPAIAFYVLDLPYNGGRPLPPVAKFSGMQLDDTIISNANPDYYPFLRADQAGNDLTMYGIRSLLNSVNALAGGSPSPQWCLTTVDGCPRAGFVEIDAATNAQYDAAGAPIGAITPAVGNVFNYLVGLGRRDDALTFADSVEVLKNKALMLTRPGLQPLVAAPPAAAPNFRTFSDPEGPGNNVRSETRRRAAEFLKGLDTLRNTPDSCNHTITEVRDLRGRQFKLRGGTRCQALGQEIVVKPLKSVCNALVPGIGVMAFSWVVLSFICLTTSGLAFSIWLYLYDLLEARKIQRWSTASERLVSGTTVFSDPGRPSRQHFSISGALSNIVPEADEDDNVDWMETTTSEEGSAANATTAT